MNPNPYKVRSSKSSCHVTSNDDVTIIKSTETLSPSDHVTNRIALLENCQAKSQPKTYTKVDGCKANNLTCQSDSTNLRLGLN